MEALASLFLILSAVLIAVPIAMFSAEVVAATMLSPRRTSTVGRHHDTAGRIAVLVPAHDESTGLLPTLLDIKRQLRPHDRLIVIADNCTDDTAAVAIAEGAEVAERHDPTRQGKGYALDFGLRHLSLDPPEIVIVVDADCRLADCVIDALAIACAAERRPVQARYLMTAPEKSRIDYRVAEFAWRVKNSLRPVGLSALGLPCQLMGTGMAFPWGVIRDADLASGEGVEDLLLGLDLASKGYPAVFCPSALVTSHFAATAKASWTQRERWESGHIGMIRRVPRLVCQATIKRNLNLLALALDLTVPPLSLLALLVIGTFAIAYAFVLLGFAASALKFSAANLLIFLLAVGLAWFKCGRDVVPIRAAWSIVGYVFGKVGFYGLILLKKKGSRWIRTDRTKPE